MFINCFGKNFQKVFQTNASIYSITKLEVTKVTVAVVVIILVKNSFTLKFFK